METIKRQTGTVCVVV